MEVYIIMSEYYRSTVSIVRVNVDSAKVSITWVRVDSAKVSIVRVNVGEHCKGEGRQC